MCVICSINVYFEACKTFDKEFNKAFNRVFNRKFNKEFNMLRSCLDIQSVMS